MFQVFCSGLAALSGTDRRRLLTTGASLTRCAIVPTGAPQVHPSRAVLNIPVSESPTRKPCEFCREYVCACVRAYGGSPAFWSLRLALRGCTPRRKMSRKTRIGRRNEGAPLPHWLVPRSSLAAIGWEKGAVVPYWPAPLVARGAGSPTRVGRSQRRLGGCLRTPREPGGRASARQVLLSAG